MKNQLPSWNDTSGLRAILDFVEAVTDTAGPQYVPPDERIAVFDNDGTLWCEKPMYIQLHYLLRELAGQAKSDPGLRTRQPWRAAWEKDYGWLGEAITKHYQGDDDDLHVLLKGILSLSKDQLVEEIEAAAREFVASERHPTLDLTYWDCAYRPMLELLRYLETNGFTNYIVSGGGRDFMRGFAQELYGIPRERVIGSTVAYRFNEGEGGGQIVQQAELDVIDDGPGKPIQIWNVIGRRPLLAAGNSNGDVPMLQFADRSPYPTLRLLILHDDAEREFSYVAGAEEAVALARQQGWSTISIKKDWQRVFV